MFKKEKGSYILAFAKALGMQVELTLAVKWLTRQLKARKLGVQVKLTILNIRKLP